MLTTGGIGWYTQYCGTLCSYIDARNPTRHICRFIHIMWKCGGRLVLYWHLIYSSDWWFDCWILQKFTTAAIYQRTMKSSLIYRWPSLKTTSKGITTGSRTYKIQMLYEEMIWNEFNRPCVSISVNISRRLFWWFHHWDNNWLRFYAYWVIRPLDTDKEDWLRENNIMFCCGFIRSWFPKWFCWLLQIRHSLEVINQVLNFWWCHCAFLGTKKKKLRKNWKRRKEYGKMSSKCFNLMLNWTQSYPQSSAAVWKTFLCFRAVFNFQ